LGRKGAAAGGDGGVGDDGESTATSSGGVVQIKQSGQGHAVAITSGLIGGSANDAVLEELTSHGQRTKGKSRRRRRRGRRWESSQEGTTGQTEVVIDQEDATTRPPSAEEITTEESERGEEEDEEPGRGSGCRIDDTHAESKA
jgi:hypothetical protein